jgi:hypothetical protein
MEGFNIGARQTLTAALTLVGLLGALSSPLESLQTELIQPTARAQTTSAPVRNAATRAPATTVNAPSPAPGRNAAGGAPPPPQLLQAYGQMPLSFTANGGQADPRFDFISRGSGYQLFLTSTEAVLMLRQDGEPSGRDRARSANASRPGHAANYKPVKMRLLGSRPEARPAGREELEGKVNYLTGGDSRNWRRGLSAYRRVEYDGVYPGIDLVYYGNQQQLEYDFVVSPGADPAMIRLGFDGVDKLTVNDAGELVLQVGKSVIKQSKPLVYQETAGGRREVAGRYVLTSRRQVSFAVGTYDVSKPLVIDPVLVYDTHFGSTFSGEESYGIAVDAEGSAYVVGWAGDGFPTTSGAFKRSSVGGDAFVIKLTPDGSGFVYSTFLGGSEFDVALDVAVDSDGSAYVVGWTTSKDFPTRNAFKATHNGGIEDGFLARLNPAGSDLVYSTYIGGSNLDSAHGIALGASGAAFVTGRTFSADFPTTPGAYRSTFSGNSFPADCYITRINTNASGQSSVIYSTYMGPGSNSIAADSAGNVYATGGTLVRKLNAAGTALIYTFEIPGLKSSPNDAGSAEDVAVDAGGNAYITGSVYANVLPVRNGFQTAFKGTRDAFLVKINSAGNEVIYSTYLGGSGYDAATSLALDASDHAYVYGSTGSTDFPKRESLQAQFNFGTYTSNFVAKINTQLSGSDSLVYSTLLGMAAHGYPSNIAVDAQGAAYLTGFTPAITLDGIIHTGRTAHPDRTPANNGNLRSPFVTKLADSSARALRFTSENYSVSEGDGKVEITLTRTGDTAEALSVDYATIDPPYLVPCDPAQRELFSNFPADRAIARCDYLTAIGTLHFAPGEASRSFHVYVTDDAYVEQDEMVGLFLLNQTPGTALSSPLAATLTIRDNDRASGVNPIDNSRFFVRQHYLEFLNREPEQRGFDDWVRVLENCPDVHNNPNCDRTTVSSAFFRSQEFQTKGSFVYRFYKVSLGRAPTYREFIADLSDVTGSTAEEVVQKKAAFTDAWVRRAEFRRSYEEVTDPAAFVDKLLQTEQVTLRGSVTRETLIEDLRAGRKTRAGVVRAIVEHPDVEAKEYHPAFVTMQYFGYLRRDPDPRGYEDWLRYLNAHPDDFRTMVRGFVYSVEYRLRFGQP